MIGLVLAKKSDIKPITDVIPKPFIPIKGKALVEFVIEKLKKSYEINKIVLITEKEYKEWTYSLKRRHYILEVKYGNNIEIINNILKEDNLIVFPSDSFIDVEIDDFINYVKDKDRFYALALNMKNGEIKSDYIRVKVSGEGLSIPDESSKVVLTDILYIPKGFQINIDNLNSLIKDLLRRKELFSYVKDGTFIKVNSLEDLDKLSKIVRVENKNKLLEAYEYSKEKYYIKLRRNRIPYIEHPIALIGFLRIFTEDEDVLIEALLHDVVEEGIGKYEEIKEKFGERVAKVSEVLNEGYKETKIEERLIRFFDTLHNFLMAFSDGSYKINVYIKKRLVKHLVEEFKDEIEYFKRYIEKRNPVKELYIDPKIYEEIKDEIKVYEDDYKINMGYPKNPNDVFIGREPLTENSYYYDKRFKNCTIYFLLERLI